MQIIARPTQEQKIWHDMEIGMFVHWAPYVYNEAGEKNMIPSIEKIRDVNFDTEQWVQTAIDLGAKYIMIVAKHAGGFCLWQTDTTPYSVKNIAWKNGKGDVLDDLSKVCRRRGLKLGVYLSPRDDYNGVRVGGKCDTPEKQAWYNGIYRQQLREVMNNYGDLVEIWFDGSTDCPIDDILNEHPELIVFGSAYANIRWVGNELGTARYPAWNGVPKGAYRPRRDDGTPDGEMWMPLECDTTIRRGWFWTPDNEPTLKSLEALLKMYYVTVGNGAVLLLNANPDRTGRIPEGDAFRARELGDLIRRLEAGKIAEMTGTGCELTLELSRPSPVDHVILAEDLDGGERVRQFTLEGRDDSGWHVLADGSAIGHKHIVRLNQDKVWEALRLKIDSYADTPMIRQFSAHWAQLPIRVESIDYPSGEWSRVYEWDASIFYGIPLQPRVFDLDISDRMQDEEDVGYYELILKNAKGQAKLLDASILVDGTVIEGYAQRVDDQTVRVYVPGVENGYLVRLNVEFDTVDTEGIVLIRQLH